MARKRKIVRSRKIKKQFNPTIGVVLLITSLFILLFSSLLSDKKNTPLKLQERITKSQESDFCLNIPVLLYHHIKPYSLAQKEGHAQLTVDNNYFEQHLSYIKSSGYTSLSADQLAQSLMNHTSLPEKSILITIDDGYDDVFTYAFPLAQKYKVILNLMIPTGLIGMKGYINWDQLQEMVKSGLVHAYNHTVSHARLDTLSKEEVEKEVLNAKITLEKNIGITSPVFAYPYGTGNEMTTEALRAAGYQAAFSTIHGYEQCYSAIMNLHRNHVGNTPLSTYGL